MGVLIAYPQSGAGGSNVTTDGTVQRTGVDQTLADIRAGAGTGHDDTGTVADIRISNSTTTNQFRLLYRYIATFDTSSLPDDTTILSASFYFYPTLRLNELSGEASDNSRLVLVASTPAADNDLANADYAQLGTTSFGESAKQDGISDSQYNEIALNASGLAAISKTGNTKLGLVLKWDFGNTTTGLTYSSEGRQGTTIATADDSTSTHRPYLRIVYSYDYPIDTQVGQFTLTGIDILIQKALNILVSVGSFTLNGIDILINRGYNIGVTVGQFILTGFSSTITHFRNWRYQPRNTTSYTNQTKNTTSYTNQTKNSTTWTPQDKS